MARKVRYLGNPFKGKSVVVVGGAAYLDHLQQDYSSYDVVCRVNYMIMASRLVNSNLNTDRCDVWYPANAVISMHPMLCAIPNVIRTRYKGIDLVPDRYKNKCSLMVNNLEELSKEVNCLPNRGLRAIVDVLSCQPKVLAVTGFTFYRDVGHVEGYYGSTPEQVDGDTGKHLQAPQIEYFDRIKHKLILDEVMSGY